MSFRLLKVLRASMTFSKLGKCCRPASWGLCVNITNPPQAHYQGEHIMRRSVVYLKLQWGFACTWPPSHLNDVKPQAPHRCRHGLAPAAWLEQAPHPCLTACKRAGPRLQNASLMHLGPRQALRLSDQSCCALLTHWCVAMAWGTLKLVAMLCHVSVCYSWCCNEGSCLCKVG